MKKTRNSPSLRQIFIRMLFFRLFIPLILIALLEVTGAAYFVLKNLESHQRQIVKSISRTVVNHIDEGSRALNNIAKVGEVGGKTNLSIVLKTTYESYGYFNTIYLLDNNKKIVDMSPYDNRYIGLDMSNLPDLNKHKSQRVIISRPFISLRTGEPTVYLIRNLSNGKVVVGELNLSILQKEIQFEGDDYAYIMDQTGVLLAHPNLNLVQQQTNMSNLGIFNKDLNGESNVFYWYNGKKVIGNSEKIKGTGWIAVDQVSLYDFIGSYAFTLFIGSLIYLIIWVALVLNLRKQFGKYVTKPLNQLTDRTNAIIVGDYSGCDLSSSIPDSFIELKKLSVDFQLMTNNLKLRENALRESENRSRGLVNRLPIGLFRANLNGDIVGANPMIVLILGYPLNEELLELNIVNYIRKYVKDDDPEKYTIEAICKLNNFEIKLENYNGKIIWVQVEIHMVYNINDEEDFLEGSIQDITDRKKSEAKVKEQQELLIQSEKEKREVLEKDLVMKDEFIALISHEFKTPLNVIYSAVQLIEYVYFDKIPKRVQELIGNIKQNTFRQLRLANNLLDITKMNADKIRFKFRNVDVVLLTRLITESIEIYAEQKNIKISFESNLENKIISIDDEKYERIMLNILSNAMKFTPNGGAINVKINEIKDSNSIEIRITDTGIGIPKDKQALIFERFGQVDSNLSRQAEGTGIGLSLVSLIIKSFGGKIEVESEVGFGSTFIITLPIKEDDVDMEKEEFFDIQSELVSKIKVEFSDIYL